MMISPGKKINAIANNEGRSRNQVIIDKPQPPKKIFNKNIPKNNKSSPSKTNLIFFMAFPFFCKFTVPILNLSHVKLILYSTFFNLNLIYITLDINLERVTFQI